jgi:hypothetical protein
MRWYMILYSPHRRSLLTLFRPLWDSLWKQRYAGVIEPSEPSWNIVESRRVECMLLDPNDWEVASQRRARAGYFTARS